MSIYPSILSFPAPLALVAAAFSIASAASASPTVDSFRSQTAALLTPADLRGQLPLLLEDALIVDPSVSGELLEIARPLTNGHPQLWEDLLEIAAELAPPPPPADDGAPPAGLTPVSAQARPLAQVEPAAPATKNPVAPPQKTSQFRVQTAFGVGYDSNFATRPHAVDSAFVSASLGAEVDRILHRNRLHASGAIGRTVYDRSAPGVEADFTFGEAALSWQRTNPGLSSIETESRWRQDLEPDWASGMTASTREGSYRQSFNRVAAAFHLTPQLTVSPALSASSIHYLPGSDALADNRWVYRTELDASHRIVGTLAATATYRMEKVEFTRTGLDRIRHAVMAGFRVGDEDRWTHRLSVGVQRQSFENSTLEPDNGLILEQGLSLPLGEATRLSAYLAHDFRDAETGLLGFPSRSTFETGITVEHRLGSDWTLVAGGGFHANDFENPGAESLEEEWLFAEFEARYRLAHALSLMAAYRFSQLTSENVLRPYDRHLFHVGVAGSF